MAKRYVYFVSVWYWTTGTYDKGTITRTEVVLEKPITTIEQIWEIEDEVELTVGNECRVMYYQLLREEADSECTTSSVPEEKIEN